MLTKPFNEHLLWKGEIQKSNYPKPICKPDFVVENTNWLTGVVIDRGVVWRDIRKRYDAYSHSYWQGVNERKLRYRLENASYE